MVKASGQIEQELALLQQKTEQMAEMLESLYGGYLTALGEAGKRQLVQAAYHLCTQAYPDRFLALSWDQRNRLQQALQAIASQIHPQLVEQREQAKKMSRRVQSHEGLAFLKRLLEARSGSSASSMRSSLGRDNDELLAEELLAKENDDIDEPDGELDDFEGFEDIRAQALRDRFEDDFEAIDFDEEDDEDNEDEEDDENEMDFEMEVPAADQRLTLDEEEDLLAALEGLARRSIELNRQGGQLSRQLGQPIDTPLENTQAGNLFGHETADDEADMEENPLSPVHLVRQQMLLEKAIRDVFKTVSDEANELLQKSNVMPNFPRALMAVASDPRGLGEQINAVPNVVRVSVRVLHGEAMMEPGDEEEEERSRPESSRGRPGRESDPRRNQAFHQNSGQNKSQNLGQNRDQNTGQNSGQNSERSRPGSASRRMRRTPRDVVEIQALPELAAISLRLSEVEFTDPMVSAWRGRLRQKLAELKKLGVRYKKTQRSLETAQAEDAWRSSWTIQDNASQ